MAEFSTLVDELSADDNVAGLILGGSRGRGVYVREESDWDLYVVLHDSADLAEYATRFPSRHGDRVEVILRSRSGLEGEPAWNRYTFCHVEPLLDRSDGWLTDTPMLPLSAWLGRPSRAGNLNSPRTCLTRSNPVPRAMILEISPGIISRVPLVVRSSGCP